VVEPEAVETLLEVLEAVDISTTQHTLLIEVLHTQSQLVAAVVEVTEEVQLEVLQKFKEQVQTSAAELAVVVEDNRQQRHQAVAVVAKHMDLAEVVQADLMVIQAAVVQQELAVDPVDLAEMATVDLAVQEFQVQ
jgi:RNA processing factor Prp31